MKLFSDLVVHDYFLFANQKLILTHNVLEKMQNLLIVIGSWK